MEIKLNLNFRFILLILFLTVNIIITEEGKKIDDSVFENIVNSIKIKNYDSELNYLTNTTDLTYLIYYYKKSSDNSKFGAYYLKKIDRKLDYLASILLVDCDLVIPANVSHCNSRSNVDNFPKIKLLVPPLYKFDPKTKKMNSHVEVDYNEDMVTPENIFNFISKHIPSYSTNLTKETISNFLAQPLFNKVILFTEKQNTPSIYKGLSSLFYDRILFGEIHSNQTEFVQQFNITKFPSIIILKNPFLLKDNYEIIPYTGNIQSEEISEFIEKHALREKNYVKRLSDMKFEKHIFSKVSKETIELFYDSEETKNKTKIVYFTNEEIDLNKIPEDIKRFASLTSGYFQFGMFNCKNNLKICKSELYVDVDKLPILIAFNPNSDYREMMKNNRLLPITFNKLLVYYVQRIKKNVKKIFSEDEFYYTISEDRKNKKYPVIYIHRNETKVNFPLHLISSIPEYQNKINFYHMDEPSDEFLELFKFTYKEPFHLIFIHDKLREDSFRIHRMEDAYKKNFIGLKTFIEIIIGDYSFPIKTNFFKIRKQIANLKKFNEMEDSSAFYRRCIYSSNFCVLAFLNGDNDRQINRVNLEYRKYLKILDSVTEDNKYRNLNVDLFYVNATCHDELSAGFKVRLSQMPSIVVYDPYNKLFAKIQGEDEFEKFKIENFLSGAFDKKIPFRQIEINEVSFKDTNCQLKTKLSKDVDYEKLSRVNRGLEDPDEDEEEENTEVNSEQLKKDL